MNEKKNPALIRTQFLDSIMHDIDRRGNPTPWSS